MELVTRIIRRNLICNGDAGARLGVFEIVLVRGTGNEVREPVLVWVCITLKSFLGEEALCWIVDCAAGAASAMRIHSRRVAMAIFRIAITIGFWVIVRARGRAGHLVINLNSIRNY